MLENIRLAFQGVWSHKLRSMLTMLGIIIGIASIISIVSTIQGTNEQIKQNLIGGGNNTVDVELYRADEKIQVSDYEQAPRGVPTITDDILQEIKDVDGVESAAAYYSRSYADSIYYNNNSLQGAQVLGVDNNYFSTTGYVVRTGRTFREEDYKEFHKVVILDQVVLTSLGGIIGVIAGNILAQVIHKVSGTPVAISIPAILISVLFSMVIGIVFGLLPSVQAANLDPIDALRHE